MAEYWRFQNNNEFLDKVKYEMQAAAIAVMAESAETASHTERVAYAKTILTGTASVKEFAIGILTNSTIKTKVEADQDYTSDLTYVTSTLFNAFAGVSL